MLGEILGERRAGPGRDPRLRARRQAPDPRSRGAQRPARARPGEAQERAPPPAARRVARPACRPRWAWTRCRCGSSASTSPTSAGRTPSRRWWSSRAARRRRAITGASRFARSIPAMITARWRRSSRAATRNSTKQSERSPYDADRDASFAALPNLVVIDGGKGQLARRPRAAAGLPRPRRGRGLAGQADRGGLHRPGTRPRSCSRTTRRSCNCCNASGTRRIVSPSPTTGSAATRR